MEQKGNVYSDLKILCHTEQLGDVLAGRRTVPIYVRIKPTNVCNQNCWYCVYANDAVIKNRRVSRAVSIPWEKLREIINDLANLGTKAITFSGGGEPLCYPQIVEAVNLVKDHEMDFAMISNGQALDSKKRKALKDANWIRISLDSADASTYRKVRGVETYNIVISNIENFAKEKNENCTLGVNCVVTEDNYNTVYELCRILSEIGVDNVKFSPMMVKDNMPEYHEKMIKIVQEQLLRAKEDYQKSGFAIIDKYTEDESLSKGFQKCPHCYVKEMFTVIGADCKVYYCHQRAYTEGGMIGDLKDQSFKELWFSEETTHRFSEMDPVSECNFRCAFEERNNLIHSLTNIDKRHINFI